MIRRIAPVVLSCLLVLAVTGSARAQEPDGSSVATAIPILAVDTKAGIEAEYRYLRRRYPGWRRVKQTLLERDGRRYDRLTIQSPEGETRDVYFDITAFFGKM